ncbi:unnamed protein product, partial [Pleuronectes platessa]
SEFQLEGDYLIGGLFDIHYLSTIDNHVRPEAIDCSSQPFLLPNYRRFQLMRFAVEEINNSTELLPNVSLGYEMFDHCSDTHNFPAIFHLMSVDGSIESWGETHKSNVSDVIAVVGPFTTSQALVVAPMFMVDLVPVLVLWGGPFAFFARASHSDPYCPAQVRHHSFRYTTPPPECQSPLLPSPQQELITCTWGPRLRLVVKRTMSSCREIDIRTTGVSPKHYSRYSLPCGGRWLGITVFCAVVPSHTRTTSPRSVASFDSSRLLPCLAILRQDGLNCGRKAPGGLGVHAVSFWLQRSYQLLLHVGLRRGGAQIAKELIASC